MKVLKFNKNSVTPSDVHDGLLDIVHGERKLKCIAVIYYYEDGGLSTGYSDCTDFDLHLMGSVLADVAMCSMKGD